MNRIIFCLLLILLASCKKENQPPTCEITHPENNAIFVIGEEIAISVEANDPDGIISEIRLYFDDLGITSIKEFPYTYKIKLSNMIPENMLLKLQQ